MSMLLMVKAMNTKVGSPLRKLVLLKLADNANDQGECWPSYQHIADQCEIGHSTVRKHIKELEKQGFLTIENRRGPKGNTSNLYRITLDGTAQVDGATLCHQIAPPVLPDSIAMPPDSTPPMPPDSTRTSHSIEPVIEPVTEPFAGDATATPAQELIVQPRQTVKSFQRPEDMPGPKDENAKTYKVWVNYAHTFKRRYGIYPVWNARVAGQLSQLIGRLGAEVAPKVAAYYLTINDQRFITEQHSVNLLLARAEALYTQWATGTRVNSTTARQQERTAANFEAANAAIARMSQNTTSEQTEAGGSVYENPYFK